MLAATRVAQMAKKVPPKVRGQVERSISPYEQTMFGDLMDVPLLLTKARRKVSDNLLSVTPGILAFVGTVTWGNWYHEKLSREHRY